MDYITISTSLLFSGKYANNYQELSSNSFYYRIKKNDYDANGYIENVEVVHLNYKELFDLYKQNKDVCFIIDPPYLSTDCSSYNNGYWRLTDYLDVLKCLQGVSYFYFTSDKSSVVELLGWLAMQPNFENPFREATLLKHKNHVNYNSQYEDMILYSCK